MSSTRRQANTQASASAERPRGSRICQFGFPRNAANNSELRGRVETDQRKRYLELGGDETYTFRELIGMLLSEIKRKRIILKIPFLPARVIAATNDFFRLITNDLVPAFLTLAQVKSLENDNLVDSKSEKFSDLGIVPTNLKIILPKIVSRFNRS